MHSVQSEPVLNQRASFNDDVIGGDQTGPPVEQTSPHTSRLRMMVIVAVKHGVKSGGVDQNLIPWLRH